MVLSLMLLSLPIPIPFDWQLPEVKKLNFVDQCFSPYVLPRLGVLWSLTPEAPGGEQEGAGEAPKRQKEESRHVSVASPWLPPQGWTFLRCVSFCFCMISFG